MAQLFPASFNTVARVSLIVGAVAPLALIGITSGVSRSPWNTKVTVPLEQPVPFSHEHHAVELGIDCRYCHTNVEKSSTAGVPPTQTCMTCHSQIWTNSPLLEPVRESYRTNTPLQWNQVHKVPEFVYFPHNIHINRGINCNQCHGPIQAEMLTYKGKPFYMAWCLDCHRNPEQYLYKEADLHKNDGRGRADTPEEREQQERLAALRTSVLDVQQNELTPREQVFNLYWKAQTRDPLAPREAALLNGYEYRGSGAELEDSTRVVDMYAQKDVGIKKQLADCSVCHR